MVLKGLHLLFLAHLLQSKTNNNGKDKNEERRCLLNLKGEVDLVCNLDWNPILLCNAIKILKI